MVGNETMTCCWGWVVLVKVGKGEQKERDKRCSLLCCVDLGKTLYSDETWDSLGQSGTFSMELDLGVSCY